MVGHHPLEVAILGSSPSSPARHNSAPCYRLQRIGPQADADLYLPTMKFFYVYVLRSIKRDFIYIGYTKNLKQRFSQHNNGESVSTKHYSPFDLIHYEAYRNINDAKRRELYFKTTKGKITLKTMLKEYFGGKI